MRTRFAWLLGLLLAGFFASFFFIRQLEQAETAQLLATARQQQATLLDHWLHVTERSLRSLAADFARHESFARLPALPDAGSARAKLSPLLANSEAQVLWLLAPDGATLLAVGRPDRPTAAALPLDLPELRGLLDGARPPHVFAEFEGGLLEFCGEPVPAAIPSAGPLGWLVVGRRWDAAHIAALSSLSEAEVRLAPADAVIPSDTASAVSLVRPLTDWRGRTLRQVVIRRETPELALLLRSDARQARVFLVFGVLVMGGLGLALNGWVLRPLSAIRESLARGDTAPLTAVRGDRTELGTIAQLVEASFGQRDNLRREVEERTRVALALRHSQEELRRTMDERASLGRDLHDGVIQSLYATGMSLAGVRVLLKPEQEEAAIRLDQLRATLNETIRDVRSFITGLEPESLQERSFAQAVSTLLNFMQSLRTFAATAEIDDAAAANLTLSQRVHSLQIAREAVSNALRHGKASAITVTLRVTGAGTEFEVRDNGVGFVPGAVPTAPGSGHGLTNFSRRARELGAELVLNSEVGRGTTVRLIFPLSS